MTIRASVLSVILVFSWGSAGLADEQLPKTVAAAARKLSEFNKKQDDAKKQKLREQILSEYRNRVLTHAVLDGLKVVGSVGYTDRNGDVGGPGAVLLPTELDEDEFVGKIEFGYFDRKIVRDLCGWISERCLSRYMDERTALKGAKPWDLGTDTFVSWGVLDAIKLDLNGRYGTNVKDPEGRNNSVTEDGFTFYVGVKWEVPLDGFIPNPLDKL